MVPKICHASLATMIWEIRWNSSGDTPQKIALSALLLAFNAEMAALSQVNLAAPSFAQPILTASQTASSIEHNQNLEGYQERDVRLNDLGTNMLLRSKIYIIWSWPKTLVLFKFQRIFKIIYHRISNIRIFFYFWPLLSLSIYKNLPGSSMLMILFMIGNMPFNQLPQKILISDNMCV